MESISFIKQASQKLGIRPALFVVLFTAFVLPFLLFGIGGGTLSLLVGAILPAYRSFKVCEQIIINEGKWTFGGDDGKIGSETSFLLKYWVVFAAIQTVEVFADFLLFWLPMYYLIKMGRRCFF